MQNLLNKLENLVEELEKSSYSNKGELDFFKKFVKTEKGIRVESILDYENSTFFVAAIRSKYKEIPFEEIVTDVLSIAGLDKSDIDILAYTFNFLDRLDDSVIEKSKEKGELYYSYLDYCDEYFFPKDFIMNRAPFLQNATEFNKMATFFNKYRESNIFGLLVQAHNCFPLIENDLISYVINLVKKGTFRQIGNTKSIKKIEREKEAMYELMKIAEEGIMYDVVEDVRAIYNLTNDFARHLSELEASEKNYIREKNHQISQYKDIINKVKNSFKIFESDIEFISDEALKQEIIMVILEKNKQKYVDLLEQLKTNQKSNINDLDKLLVKYNIIITDEIDKNLIATNVNLSELNEKLQCLSNKSFKLIKEDQKKLVKILLFSSVDIIRKIESWIEKDIITQEFITENVEVFINIPTENEKLELLEKMSISSKFEILNNNIELFRKNNVCLPNIKKYNIDFFLSENNEYVNTFKILSRYNLNLCDENLIDFSILEKTDCLNMIDLLIENDMYDYLKTHMFLVNKDRNFIKRIMLLKEIGYKIFDENNSLLNIVAEDNKFYVSDESLDLYIMDDTTKHMNVECYFELEQNSNNIIDEQILDEPIIAILENNFKLDNYRYYFDGVIISRNKVLRYMTTLKKCVFEEEIDYNEKLISSILFNSILDEESIIKIIKNVDGKIKNSKVTIKN